MGLDGKSAVRVLHVLPSLDPRGGGPSRSVPALCRALHGSGVDVSLFALRIPNSPITVSPEGEEFVIRLFRATPGLERLPTIESGRAILKEVSGFDLVHLHLLWSPLVTLTAFACRRAGVPYVLSPRGTLQSLRLNWRKTRKELYYRLCERHTVAGADALHFLSEAERANSEQFLGAGASILIVPNGIDPSLGRGISAGSFLNAFPRLRGKRLLLFVGRIHWIKGLDVQAEAVSLLSQKFPDLMWV